MKFWSWMGALQLMNAVIFLALGIFQKSGKTDDYILACLFVLLAIYSRMNQMKGTQ